MVFDERTILEESENQEGHRWSVFADHNGGRVVWTVGFGAIGLLGGGYAFVVGGDAIQDWHPAVFAGAKDLALRFDRAWGVQGAGFDDVDGGVGGSVRDDGGAAVGAESA